MSAIPHRTVSFLTFWQGLSGHKGDLPATMSAIPHRTVSFLTFWQGLSGHKGDISVTRSAIPHRTDCQFPWRGLCDHKQDLSVTSSAIPHRTDCQFPHLLTGFVWPQQLPRVLPAACTPQVQLPAGGAGQGGPLRRGHQADRRVHCHQSQGKVTSQTALP